jgi:DNA-binding MarR family transcriptional regulator
VGSPGSEAISAEELLELDVDLLVPAAVEMVITQRNAARIRARVIVEGANGPTTPEADLILDSRGVLVVPDILANAGVVVVSYFEWVQATQRYWWGAAEIDKKLSQRMTSGWEALGSPQQENTEAGSHRNRRPTCRERAQIARTVSVIARPTPRRIPIEHRYTLGDSPMGSQRMTDLADGVVYSRSGLTCQAQTLEKRGLVIRAPSSDDERSITVSITEQGRVVLAGVFPGHIAILADLLFDPLSRADIETLADILGRARDHMRQTPPRSAAPRRRKKAAAEKRSQ